MLESFFFWGGCIGGLKVEGDFKARGFRSRSQGFPPKRENSDWQCGNSAEIVACEL